MKIGISILSILIVVIFSNCTTHYSTLEKEYWNYAIETNKIGDYMTFAANFPDSKRIDSCILIMDSLVKVQSSRILISGYCLDTNGSKVLLQFSDLSEFDYWLKRRNAFILTVTNNGLFHNEKLITQENVFKKIAEYQENHLLGENYPQSKEIIDKFFGSILVSKMCVVIETNETEIVQGYEFNWQLYLETIQLVKKSYFKIWNEKAQLTWKMDFEELEVQKQAAIINTAIVGMELNFIKRTFYREEIK